MKTVREGQIVWPYCGECGCRLWVGGYAPKLVAIEHFMEWLDDKDARGHECTLLYEQWIDKESNIYQGLVQSGSTARLGRGGVGSNPASLTIIQG